MTRSDGYSGDQPDRLDHIRDIPTADLLAATKTRPLDLCVTIAIARELERRKRLYAPCPMCGMPTGNQFATTGNGGPAR